MGLQSANRERVTALLRQWQAGDVVALEQLMPLVHAELRQLARLHLRREARGRTLQPTAVVNELYLRLTRLHEMTWESRAHFFSMASRLMRRVLVDAARERRAKKRASHRVRVTFDEAIIPDRRYETAPDILALDEALTALATRDARKARVVELRFFGGLSVEETAAEIGVSVETVARDWRFAKLWLRREIMKG